MIFDKSSEEENSNSLKNNSDQSSKVSKQKENSIEKRSSNSSKIDSEKDDESNLKILNKLEVKMSKKKVDNPDKFSDREDSERDDSLRDNSSKNIKSKIFGNKGSECIKSKSQEKDGSSNTSGDEDEDSEEKKDFIPNIKELNKKKVNSSDDSVAKIKKSFSGTGSEEDSEKKDKFGNDSNSHTHSDEEHEKIPEFTNADDIVEYFKELRNKYRIKEKDGSFDPDRLFKDPSFPDDKQLFYRNGELPKKVEGLDIEFERPSNVSDQTIDNQKIEFFATDSSHNINFQFKIKKGIMNDKFFIGCIMMLFKSKEEYFTNLVIDYENINENIKYGFCGFQFFINGEWKYVVIDTKLPTHQTDELAVSCAISNKTTFWLSLCCKAYSKVFNSYDILNDVSIKNVLVDLTGGTSKKIEIPQAPQVGGIPSGQAITDNDKKYIFEELKRCVQQNYLIGCTKEEEVDEEDFDDSQSDNNEEEEIIVNSMYVILDVQDVDGLKLIYLNNSWGRGKWSGNYGPEDENWETNKGLKEKLGYENQADGTFWMLFNEFLDKFDNIYYCRIYPQSWYQFCIPGKWNSFTSGGSPIMPGTKNEETTVNQPAKVNKIGSMLTGAELNLKNAKSTNKPQLI